MPGLEGALTLSLYTSKFLANHSYRKWIRMWAPLLPGYKE